jgi:hypothetical protein
MVFEELEQVLNERYNSITYDEDDDVVEQRPNGPDDPRIFTFLRHWLVFLPVCLFPISSYIACISWTRIINPEKPESKN